MDQVVMNAAVFAVNVGGGLRSDVVGRGGLRSHVAASSPQIWAGNEGFSGTGTASAPQACGQRRRGAYFAGLAGDPQLAARSSAMIWRRFSMPSLVKAGTPSSPTPWTQRQPSSGNMLIDRSKIQFSSSPSSLAT